MIHLRSWWPRTSSTMHTSGLGVKGSQQHSKGTGLPTLHHGGAPRLQWCRGQGSWTFPGPSLSQFIIYSVSVTGKDVPVGMIHFVILVMPLRPALLFCPIVPKGLKSSLLYFGCHSAASTDNHCPPSYLCSPYSETQMPKGHFGIASWAIPVRAESHVQTRNLRSFDCHIAHPSKDTDSINS